MRYMSNGTPVTSLNVATNRKYTGSDGSGQRNDLVPRECIRQIGRDRSTISQESSAVLVEGRLTPDKTSGGPRTYQRQDGTMGATYEVAANTVRFLGSRGEGGPGPARLPAKKMPP